MIYITCFIDLLRPVLLCSFNDLITDRVFHAMLINRYRDLTVTPAGVLPSTEPVRSYGAHFRLDADVRLIFPYIRAENETALYFDNPEYIQFIFNRVKCSLYPNEVIAVPFDGEKSAEIFADALVAYLNDLERRKATLKPNHRRFRSIPVPDLFRLLPGTNCGKCGYKTCLAFAAHLSVGEAVPDSCGDFAKPIRETKVYPVYDLNGNLSSTISIETDIVSDTEPKRHPPVRIASTGVYAELTKREREVLALVASGITNKEISDKLFISHHTVKSHVVHIFNKLGVNDRTQAAVWAAKNDIV